MDNLSPQQRPESLGRGGGHQASKRRMKYQSYRRQSAPSLVITKALTRSKTLSRESFQLPVFPERCSLVQSFLAGFDRSFLLHGHVQLRTGMQTQDRHLFLFTDILVISKAKSANNFKRKAQVRVCQMWTTGYTDEVYEGSTSPERSFVMGWPTCNYVATFSSTEDKEKWFLRLKSRIKEEKENEEPKTIPLRVYGKGINTFAVTKTLPVSNWDSTNEVVRLALQQFGVIGNVKDFQLWVISKKDNVPYPLIGHEFPFSIQMSHVIPTPSPGGEGRDTAAPPVDRQVALQMEQLQVYKQCQFILKPRPTDTQNLPAELPQKPLKRRRSFIGWAFWRGSSSHLNDPSLSTPRGCLFGQPLGSVCIDGALPKPVMDMLAFLYAEGSWTRGIFRRPAGARAVRELRDTLDSGNFQLPLTRDHVFVIAGVFKDFLRSIPGSLLCSELHEEWMDVLDEEDEEEEQVQDIKRMISRLPNENALLLRYLLAMLHGIQGNAQENQMTSFNLSVCIAPSMLWPPGAPCSNEAEGEGTKKVCELVKFMIEHCRQILGEDPSSLYGGPPPQPPPEETGSEWFYPMTDSSYDSLENELDHSSSSPSFCNRRQLRAETLRGSLDSILTFSDCDQDTDPEILQAQPDSEPRLKVHPLERHRARRLKPGVSYVSRDTQTVNSGSRERRCSEPAITYVAKFRPCASGMDDANSEELPSQPPNPCGETKKGGGTSAGLEASSSSLSSISPDPTRSSLDSPDSLDSDITWVRRRGLYISRTNLPSASSTTSNPQPSGAPPEHSCCPKGSPPKEPLTWGTLKSCQSLHPNSWLKKGRRLSLTQQDNLAQEEDKSGGGPSHKSLTFGKHASEKGKAGERGEQPAISNNRPQQKPSSRVSRAGADGSRACLLPGKDGHSDQHLKRGPFSPPPHHRSTGSLSFSKPSWFHSSESLLPSENPSKHNTGSEEKTPNRPSPPLFMKESSSPFTLLKQSKAAEEQRSSRLYQRRGSEPGRQVIDRSSGVTRARLPSDPGLKVTEVDIGSQGEKPKARFCLSPCATKAVRDYFSSHPDSSPHSSQQVALALVESRREWLKRCNDPTADVDFEQLLFAEESYV
ncbi:rho GTPase-activating protein 20-like isoform X1 [Takifugu flavidus]|uniref:rho GTPase-activating protein 20-like isoform X1 n=2 Tax=Takifugu flavidus TaxID=433684 RepID=UPI002544A2F8|nr:rho GTPase-activating protein 20-like isoform X1 [Takifugu flavidus]